MSEHVNHLGQPIGFPLPEWTARKHPPRTAMEGRYCTVEPVAGSSSTPKLGAK